MCKFLHTADWHIGARNVPQPVFDTALDKLQATARSEAVDFVLCVGDVFDRPRPAQRTKDFLLKFILDNDDLFFVFTVGNHDFENKDRTYHSLMFLKMLVDAGKLTNASVIAPGECAVNEDGTLIEAVGAWEDLYTAPTVRTAPYYIRAFHGMPSDKSAFFDGKLRAYLFAEHERMMQTSGVDYIALGDIHKDIFPYPGTLVQKTYSCESGIILVDLDKGNIRGCKLDIPKKVTVDLTNAHVDEGSVISGILGCPDSSFVRVKTAIPLPVFAGLDKGKIKDAVRGKNHWEVKFSNIAPIESLQRSIPPELRTAKTIYEEVEALVLDDSYGLKKDKLLRSCRGYVESEDA